MRVRSEAYLKPCRFLKNDSGGTEAANCGGLCLTGRIIADFYEISVPLKRLVVRV